MTIKQLWLATVTLLAVFAFSRPDALFDIARYSGEAFVWVLLSALEHLVAHGLGQ